MNSITANTNAQLNFHLIVQPEDETSVQIFIDEANGKFAHASFDYATFTFWEEVRHLYRDNTRFGNSLNVARIYLEKLFPNVEKVISLDTDIVVNADLQELWEEADVREVGIAAPCSGNGWHLGHYLRWYDNPILNSSDVDMSRKVFGGGLFVANLTTWRDMQIAEQIEMWGEIQAQKPVIQKTLKKMLLNMIFNRHYLRLSWRWNAGNCLSIRTLADARSQSVIHFSGKAGKPWSDTEEGADCTLEMKQFWREYFEAVKYEH